MLPDESVQIATVCVCVASVSNMASLSLLLLTAALLHTAQVRMIQMVSERAAVCVCCFTIICSVVMVTGNDQQTGVAAV